MKKKLLYWLPTGLFSAFILNGCIMYAMNPEQISVAYEGLGYPGYLMYINGIAKFLGIVAILAPVSNVLKEWAFAGLFYVLVLGTVAHVQAADGMWQGAAIGLVLWATAYTAWKKR